MKRIFSVSFLLLSIVSCQFSNKSSDKTPSDTQSQPSVYMELNNALDQMSNDILSSIKTNNYSSFSNYLSSKDTVLNFIKEEIKGENYSAKEIEALTDNFSSMYTKSLITTKTDFDFVIKKGIQQGIIWNDAKFDKATWRVSKDKDFIGSTTSFNLELTIDFKYKGVAHSLNFIGNAFMMIDSKWVLMKEFYLDNFTETSAIENDSQDTAISTQSEPMSMDTSKMMMDVQKK